MTVRPTTALFDAVQRARRLPWFARKYGDVGDVSVPDDLASLPTMDKSDLEAAAHEVLAALRDDGAPAYVFGSGGTTGAPKLSFIDPGMHVSEIVREWAPLRQGDRFLNLFAPGRLWSGHYFYNELATALGAVTVPVGNLQPMEHLHWASFAATVGVTAVGGTPTTLRDLFASCSAARVTLPDVSAVLWVGERFGTDLDDVARRVVPNAGMWGLYGSTETWVIAHNGPRCARDVFHPLHHQVVEVVDDGAILVTNTHPRSLNVIVRYRPGDRGAWDECPCGRPGAVRVLGRADGVVKFRGSLVHPEELCALVAARPDVAAAQLAIVSRRGGPERLELRCVARPGAAPDPAAVRAHVLGQSLDLGNLFDDDADGLRVVLVDRLAVNERSGKTPALVREEEERR